MLVYYHLNIEESISNIFIHILPEDMNNEKRDSKYSFSVRKYF